MSAQLFLDSRTFWQYPSVVDEKRLWTAVLLQSIKDVTGFAIANNERQRVRLEQAARWWFASSSYHVGSYCWVCDQLELDPSWLRRRMVTVFIYEQARTQGEHFSMTRLEGMLNGADEHTAQCADDLLSA